MTLEQLFSVPLRPGHPAGDGLGPLNCMCWSAEGGLQAFHFVNEYPVKWQLVSDSSTPLQVFRLLVPHLRFPVVPIPGLLPLPAQFFHP